MSAHDMTRDRLLREVVHDLSGTMLKLLNQSEELFNQHGPRLRALELSMYRTKLEEVAIINEMAKVLIEIGFRQEAEKLLTDTLQYCRAQLCVNVEVNTARTLASLGELYYQNGRSDKAYMTAREALMIMLSRESWTEQD